ncbi:MAG: dethiobiotin synthase [Sulfuricurvum sp.]|uniref:dethiobiotin synthase n=1 Tax=Sulfuricurvum sp. TaxID=2025608 RepID=UPI0025FE5CD2|nr:dethiobiotin synthase [Sulfuricurvum sp.]MCI4407359.1 dethiobiotin synthase [Sulfuricurvum sp.]
MSKRIFVTATNTNVGKTYTSKQLIKALFALGLRVGVFKPIETGVENFPLDGKELFDTACRYNPALHSLSINDIVPLQFPLPAAPFVANQGESVDLSVFDAPLAKIEALCDVVIIEGAGGLFVPIDKQTMMIDFPRYFNAVTLLVTHCNLGCINDTLLSAKALSDNDYRFILGFNCRADDETFEKTSLPYLNHRFGSIYRIDHDIDVIAKALLDTIST